MANKPNGNLTGIKSAMLDRLKSLYDFKQGLDEFASFELLSELCACSGEINREISVYISRDGGIVDVSVGDSAKVSMPSMRLVRNEDRLCGVRCIHTHPSAILLFNIPSVHEAGYICSMLFIIPGFPFITSGIDLAKLDIRSGIERLTYSAIIVLVATVFAWIMALILHLQPEEFSSLNIGNITHLILRLIASFCGVFGFSIMFNSSIPMAATTAVIGAIANTLRLELVDFTAIPAAAAAFIGAVTAGLLASFIKKYNGYPRISLTVPSIVIMVPGLYLYRAIYNFGIMSLTEAVSWFTSAVMIIIALPLGLIFARIITDRPFRYCT